METVPFTLRIQAVDDSEVVPTLSDVSAALARVYLDPKPVLLGPPLRPQFGSSGAAGLDLYAHTLACSPRNSEVLILGTGVWLHAAQPDVMLSLRDRSGLGAAGVHVYGGVIDSDYRGEIKVMLTLLNAEAKAALTTALRNRSAIAQLVAHRVCTQQAALLSLDALRAPVAASASVVSHTERGANGWGSTDAAAAHC